MVGYRLTVVILLGVGVTLWLGAVSTVLTVSILFLGTSHIIYVSDDSGVYWYNDLALFHL